MGRIKELLWESPFLEFVTEPDTARLYMAMQVRLFPPFRLYPGLRASWLCGQFHKVMLLGKVLERVPGLLTHMDKYKLLEAMCDRATYRSQQGQV